MKNKLLLCLLVSAISFKCKKNEAPSSNPVINNNDTIRNTQILNSGIAHQKGKELKVLDVVQGNSFSNQQKVLIASLQGLAAKTSSEQIYIEEGGPSTVWKDYLKSRYSIKVNNYTTLVELLNQFKTLVTIKGYVLYDGTRNARSLTAATSLSGPMNAIAVDKTLESTVQAAGITNKLLDVSDKDEKWVYANYPYAFSKKNAAELSPTIAHNLRDYISLTNSFAFYDGNTAWRTTILKNLDAGAYCYGYGQSEFDMVSDASAQGVTMLPSDVAANLSPLSSIYNTEGLQQQPSAEAVPSEENVHYVTFLTSDGDNIAFDLWSLQSYFSYPLRGSFAMGFTVSPSMYDLAPAALNWYFTKATSNDRFVCGPSGSGYMFPSKMPAAKLDAYLSKLNTFTGATGLRICNILDQGAINNMTLWNKYLAQPNIDALIYTGYGEAPHGSIQFASNGKPVIEQRDNLWAGLEEEQTVISNINSRPADPHSAEGYSLVFVHVWTKDLSNVRTVIQGLNSNVRVVTPDVFVKLVQKNLK